MTDHRVNVSVHNLEAVMDGDLVALIEKLREHDREARLEALAKADA